MLAELERQLRGKHHGFRIIAVDVQHRSTHELGDVGAVAGGAGVFHVGGGEAHLIVDHHMHGAAHREAACLRHLEQLHHHTLAGKRRIAVDQDGHDLLAGVIATALLTRAHAAGDHRIHDFQMRGVERQRQMHRAAGGTDIGREPHVVFHVSGNGVFVVVEFAFELIEQFARVFAQCVHQYVQTAAMGHPDDDVLDTGTAGTANDGVHQWNQRIAAFQRKAFLADVFGVQVALQTFGGGQAFQRAAPGIGIQVVIATGRFQPLIQPLPLVGLENVHELCTDTAGVGGLQVCNQITQLHSRLTRHAAGAELIGKIRLAQMVETQIQIRWVDRRGHAQRVKLGSQVPA